MIIKNETNRTSVEVSVPEALKLMAALANALALTRKYGVGATTPVGATEMSTAGFKPSSFVIIIGGGA